jgi:uncharacterized metal-binding protein YceD (DUF177 family)
MQTPYTLEEGYSIDLPKLAVGAHHFRTTLDETFFALFPDSPVHKGAVQVDIKVQRSRTQADIRLTLAGTVVLECDRCFREYDYMLQTEQRLIYDQNSSLKELDDSQTEVFHLAAGTRFIELKQDLYDFVVLALPYRRLPPDCPGAACPPEVLRLLEQAEPEPNPESSAATEEDAQLDPRWSALAALKKKLPNTDN